MLEGTMQRIEDEINKIMDSYRKKKSELDYIGSGIWVDEKDGNLYHIVSGKPYPIMSMR